MDGFIAKPINIETLKKEIDEILLVSQKTP
jgi:hypothetical protein